MPKIATCNRCSIDFFDSTDAKDTCTRCHHRDKEIAAKVGKWKRRVAFARETGKFTTQLSSMILQIRYREGLNITEIAEILNFTEHEVKLEVDILRQNAR